MTDEPSNAALSNSSGDGQRDRVICVVARDVLSLERRDVGLDGLLAAIWRGRWLMLVFILGFGCAAIVYSYLTTPWYLAETVLVPTSKSDIGGLASQLGSLGALTGLSGINLSEGGNTDESLGVLESHDFARAFIEDQKLLHVFFRKDWDANAGRWKESDPERQPDIRDAVRLFDKDILVVNQDRRTGLVTLGIRWTDPVLAATWANTLVERVNAQMRARALAEGEANIDYLQQEMSLARQMNVQAAIAQLIETEIQKSMVARSNREFAFRVIDHAEVPKFRAWPRRGIIAVLGVIAGGLAGLVAVFINDLLLKRRSVALPGASS